MKRNAGRKASLSRRDMLLRGAAAAVAFVLVLVGIYALSDALDKGRYEEGRSELPVNNSEPRRVEYDGKVYIQNENVTTVLVMGIDREGDGPAKGFRNGGQADFLQLLVLDHEADVVRQLQIDRDTMAEVTMLGVLGNVTGTRVLQICLAHGYGQDEDERCQHQIEAVEKLLQGVDVELYLSLDMRSIDAFNDALGGVTVTLEDDFSEYDPQMTVGATVTLMGDQAELFVRSRTSVGDGTNESRMRRQRAYMQAVAQTLRAKIDENVNFAGTLYDSLDGVLTSNAKRGRLINLVNQARGYDIQPVTTLAGEYKIGEDGFMEFHARDDAITAWVLETFFTQSNPG